MYSLRKFLLTRLLLIGLVFSVGAFAIFEFNKLLRANDVEKEELRMIDAQNKAVYRFESSIENFATFVAGLRSYIHMSERMPRVEELQEYINTQLDAISYNEDLVVSYIDTSQVFRYVFTRNQIDPAGLVGKSVYDLREAKEMPKLFRLLESDQLHLYDPMNVREGWIGIPVDFRVVRDGHVVGYIAPILNLQIVLDNIYLDWDVDEYILNFSTEEGVDFDRQAFHNGSEVFNGNADTQFYRNFDVEKANFLYKTVELYGKKFNIGIARKNLPVINSSIIFLLLGWFVSMVGFAVVIVLQLSRLRQLNVRLFDREQKLREAQSISKLGYWEVDMSTRESLVSDGFYEIFGIKSEVEKRRLKEDGGYFKKWIHPDDLASAVKSYLIVARGEESPSQDYRIIDSSQKVRHIHSIVRSKFGKKSNPQKVWGTIQDITERKRSEERLQKQYSELEVVNAELDRFVYSVTHDLKSPLANMEGLIKLTMQEEEPTLAANYFSLMEASVKKMRNFIDELIIYAKNANQEVLKERVDIKSLLAEIVKEHQFEKDSEGIRFNIDITGGTVLWSDQSRIRIIMNNLISNAIKYHDKYKNDKFVMIDCLVEEEQITIKVTDNGIGMKSEDVDKIFDMFYRTSTGALKEGSGIGLHIVKEAIKKIGGSISTESEVGIGTTFTILLPIR